MVIITTKNNNQTIVKQLTELMNKNLDSTLKKTLEKHKTIVYKKHDNNYTAFCEKRSEFLQELFAFIHDWAENSFYDYGVHCYTLIMSSTNRFVVKDYWVNRSLHYCLDEKTVLAYKNRYGHKGFTIEYLNQNPKNNYLQSDDKANSLLDDYTTFNGTAEQAVLALIKPLLINGFVDGMINELDVTTEFIEVINNYNDDDYHLNRFVKSLEKGMLLDNKHNPLDLRTVWGLWDEDFMKKTVVPFLKKKELSDLQKKSLDPLVYCRHDDLSRINNYYDYCFTYSYASGVAFPALEDTLFLYGKEEFEQAVSTILFALDNAARFVDVDSAELELLETKNELLYRCAKENLGDWVDCLR